MNSSGVDRGLSPVDARGLMNGRSPNRLRALWSKLGSHPRELGMQGVVGGFAIAFCVSTFVVNRPPSGYSTIWDGWIYTIAETLPLIPVLLRVRRSPEFRSAWLAMATMIVLNTLGDLVYTYHDQNLLPIPDPAPSDVLYLLSYAAFIVGVALLTQSSFGRVHASVRLDGAIAGLAMGAVAGMAWFEPLLHVSGRPLQVAVDMAYPLSDLVLIVLLVAGLAPHRYRPNWSTVWLFTGVAWFVLGDVIYLNRSVAGTYVAGTPLDATWIIGLFFVGLAASARDRRRSGGPRSPVSSPAGITVVPVAFGLVSLAVLAAALFRHVSPVVSAMAIAALCLVIGRMWMTLREVRQMTLREMHQSAANFLDVRTDYLTGLPNRRAFIEHLQSAFSSQQATAAACRGSLGRSRRLQGGQRCPRPRSWRRASLFGGKTIRAPPWCPGIPGPPRRRRIRLCLSCGQRTGHGGYCSRVLRGAVRPVRDRRHHRSRQCQHRRGSFTPRRLDCR